MDNRFAHSFMVLVFAALAVALTSPRGLVPTASAQAPIPAAMLVIDGSASMWGQIAGGNKIVIVRQQLGELFSRHDTSMSLGLIAFGHRRPIGCDDVQTLSPLTALEAKRHATLVRSINPRGATPIGAALRQAARVGKAETQALDIVLIADGLDNCRTDPCAVAGALKQTAPALRIHVIGFADAKVNLQKLQCISEATGGAFVRADSAAALKTALESSFATILAPRANEIAVAQVASPATTETDNLPVGSIVEEGSFEFDDFTSIENDGSDAAAIAQLQLTQAQVPAQEPAPAQAAQPVGGGGTPVSLAALVTEAGPPIEDGVIWRIFNTKPGPDGGYRLISTHRDAATKTALPPGDYLINAAYGLSNLTRKITVEAGKPLDEKFVLNTGGLKLGAALSSGDPIQQESVRYDVFSDETDQFGNRERLLENAKPGLVVRLNSGVYHVVSTYGDANAIIRADVTIEPGKLTEATINHAAAQVSFKLVTAPGGEALADTQWKVTSSGGDVIKETAGALPSHILAAGDYTVVATHGGLPYSREFKVESGKPAQIEVVLTQ